jgi:HEAT repeat protein
VLPAPLRSCERADRKRSPPSLRPSPASTRAVGAWLWTSSTTLRGTSEGNWRHASAAFARCGESAAAALASALPKQTKAESRVTLADELSRVSPEAMVAAVVPLLDSAKPKERRAYRLLIGSAASQERARDAIAAELAKESTSPRELLDLLRALGPNASVFGDAAHRGFARLAAPNATFRTRYLLLGPAAELARTDAAAQAYLRQALVSDERAEIRAEAARSVRDVGPLLAELTHAADDARVRVREASVIALGASRLDAAVPTVARRLRGDPWPLVRRAAAEALAELPASARIDDEIARTVEEDESPEVRRASVRVLGVHRAVTKSGVVRERLTDKVEDTSVRAEAALALGAMCDASSTDLLTEHAKKLVDPGATDEQRTIGRNALTALAWLGPKDLDARVASLRGAKTPVVVRKLTELALSGRGRCPPVRSTAAR